MIIIGATLGTLGVIFEKIKPKSRTNNSDKK